MIQTEFGTGGSTAWCINFYLGIDDIEAAGPVFDLLVSDVSHFDYQNANRVASL